MPSSRQSRIAALPAHMQEVLRRRLAGQATQSDPIPPADRTEPLPLSFPQQRLWFVNEFQSGWERVQQRACAAPARPVAGAGVDSGPAGARGPARVVANHLRRDGRARNPDRAL